MKEYSSDYVRTHLREVLNQAIQGEIVAIMRYRKMEAVIIPVNKWEELCAELEQLRTHHESTVRPLA